MNNTYLTRAAVRELDRRAIEEYGVPSIVLMENAGRGVAVQLRRLNPEKLPTTIICGPGNNGGDGFVMARHLANYKYPARVWLFAPSRPGPNGPEPKLSTDCDLNYQIFKRSDDRLVWFDTSTPELQTEHLHRITDEITLGEGWIVDALFGTGLDRELGPPYVEIVAAINASRRPVLAIDIPSGLDADTGQPLGPTVRATNTATFVAPKKGFQEEEAAIWLGEVHTVDIGAPRKLVLEFLNAEG